mmetsp:Transcript_109095/g.315187  ORF Transcript_109095/g.315187 Transcript_109095/m.315187 type:complete len:363 (+) Transcript_109095:106-1194(+)
MKWILVSLFVLELGADVSAWVGLPLKQGKGCQAPSLTRKGLQNLRKSIPSQQQHQSIVLFAAEPGAESADDGSTLSDEEFQMIADLYEKSKSGDATLDQVVLEALPTIHPQLIMKLRGSVEDSREEFQAVSSALSSILDAQLSQARDLLADFLNAGEVRKLDSLIGKAGRDGKLDVAFFQVLNMNLQDAAADPEPIEDPESDEPTASRFQILQHIYTRCQEEIEKTIPPGVSLLNKLLRTEQPSIRSNQLQHYLCPQPNVIKTPDGKELELKGRDKILVSHEEFVDAIGNAVKQIRTVEKAGGANREMAANMVESCRQVAKEARIIIGEHFGRESEELKNFEDSLQPIFRPESADSPYITGA